MTSKEAIKILKGAIKKPNTKDGYLGQALDMAIQALEQPSVTDFADKCQECGKIQNELLKNKWIPVSERLPEPDVEVLVTDDAGGLATISTDSICEIEVTGEKEWYASQNVIAWMPLPPSYQGE